MGNGSLASVSVPEDLADEILTLLIQAVDQATPERDRPLVIISAMGKLPTNDPRLYDTLMHLHMYGEGRVPHSALISLGSVRPERDEFVTLLKRYMEDRYSVYRNSAIASARRVGVEASELQGLVRELND